MPRRYRRGRRAAGRRRQYGVLRKRRAVGGRLRTALAKKTHWFKEMYQSTSLVGTAAATTGGIINFSLNELANAGSFKAMFDLYKIKAVKLKIIPRWNVSDAATPTNTSGQMGNLPVLYIAPNRDPYVPTPTSLGDILNDDGCRVIRLTKPVNLYLSAPKPKITAFSGGSEIADVPLMFNVGSKWQPWLTTGGNGQSIDQSGILHYGFRYMINNEAAADCVLDTYYTLYFACKEQD